MVVTNGRRSIEQGIEDARAMALAWPYDRIHRQHFLRSKSDAFEDSLSTFCIIDSGNIAELRIIGDVRYKAFEKRVDFETYVPDISSLR